MFFLRDNAIISIICLEMCLEPNKSFLLVLKVKN